MVPCDPIKYLDNEYGANNWQKPIVEKYYWKNLVFKEYWKSDEWPKAVKFFDRRGRILRKKILNYVRKYGEPPLNHF